MAASLQRADVATPGGVIAFGAVAAGYTTVLGPVNNGRKLVIVNTFHTAVLISLDGTTDWLELPASTGLTIDFDTSTAWNGTFAVRQGPAGAVGAGRLSAAVIRGR